MTTVLRKGAPPVQAVTPRELQSPAPCDRNGNQTTAAIVTDGSNSVNPTRDQWLAEALAICKGTTRKIPSRDHLMALLYRLARYELASLKDRMMFLNYCDQKMHEGDPQYVPVETLFNAVEIERFEALRQLRDTGWTILSLPEPRLIPEPIEPKAPPPSPLVANIRCERCNGTGCVRHTNRGSSDSRRGWNTYRCEECGHTFTVDSSD